MDSPTIAVLGVGSWKFAALGLPVSHGIATWSVLDDVGVETRAHTALVTGPADTLSKQVPRPLK